MLYFACSCTGSFKLLGVGVLASKGFSLLTNLLDKDSLDAMEGNVIYPFYLNLSL